MKKTILMLAGVAVLASCAKEIAPDVYEQAPAATGKYTIVADRGGDTDTKVAYNPLVENTALRTTWKKEDKLGIFTYKAPTNDENDNAAWTNYPGIVEHGNPFSTTELFEGKTSASFTGNLNAFETKSFIYGVYPSPGMAAMGDTDATKGTITFTYQEEGVTFSSETVVKDEDGNDLYISNATEATNSIILFRSSEEFSLGNGLESTALPALTGKMISAKINLTLAKEDKGANMEDEFAELQSIKLTALDETGEKVAAFHKEMKINLLDFEDINSLKLADNNAKDIEDALYTGAAEPVESLTFTSDYTLYGGKEIVLPIILFPTEKFAKIEAEIEWIDNAGVSETTKATIGWTSAHQLGAGANISYWDKITLGKSTGTNITALPANVTDVRNYIIEAIKAGKTHIKVGKAENLLLYDRDYTNQDYAEVYDQKPALIIPEEASGKDIVIEAYVKDAEGAKFTPLFTEGYNYGVGGSLTFILKNTATTGEGEGAVTDDADLENIEFVLNDPEASIILTSAKASESNSPAPAYKNVTVKAVKNFTLEKKAATLSIDEDAAPELVKIAAEVTDVDIADKAAIETLIVEKGGKVGVLNTKATQNITINGQIVGALTVNPTIEGTNITVGEFTGPYAVTNEHGIAYGYVGKIVTRHVDDLKYSSFTLNGRVGAESELDTREASYVEINGDLSTVAVTVNATAGDGTKVKIGACAQVASLATVKTGTNSFESFTIDGKVGGTALNTRGATEVTIGSLTKDEYTTAATVTPAIANYFANNYAKVPALTTTGATTVTIGYKATVASLVPDTAKDITINGTISNNALGSNQIDTFILGEDGKIAKGTGTNTELYLIPESGTKVELLGTLEDVSIVRVGNLTESLVTKATAAAAYEVFKVPVVNMTLGANARGMNFNECNGTVDITASENTTALPSISFNDSPGADVKLTATATAALTSAIENVQNITLVEGTFGELTLNASKKIEIQGTATKRNTFNDKLSLTAKDIEISQYTVFGGEAEKNVTISATGDVTIGGDKKQIDMNNKQTLVMKKAGSFNMTNVKVGNVQNYGTMTLTNCEITDAANMGDGLLEFNWDYEYVAGTTTIDTINAVTYNLVNDFAHRGLASDIRLKLFFKDPGNVDNTPVTGEVTTTNYGNRSKKALVTYKSDYAFYNFDDFAKVLKRTNNQ